MGDQRFAPPTLAARLRASAREEQARAEARADQQPTEATFLRGYAAGLDAAADLLDEETWAAVVYDLDELDDPGEDARRLVDLGFCPAVTEVRERIVSEAAPLSSSVAGREALALLVELDGLASRVRVLLDDKAKRR